MTSSMRCPFTKSTHGTCWSRANRRIAALNASVIFPQWGGGSDPQPQLALHIAQQARRELQLRDVGIALHPVDALHREHHVIGKDIGDGAR